MTATYLEKDLMWVWPTPHSNKLFANKTVLAFENWRKKIIKGKWEIIHVISDPATFRVSHLMQLWCADSYLGVRVCVSRYENMKLLTIGKETKAEHIYKFCSYICLTRLCTVFRSVVVMLQSVQFFTACLLLGMQKMLGVHTGQSGWISTKTVWTGLALLEESDWSNNLWEGRISQSDIRSKSSI